MNTNGRRIRVLFVDDDPAVLETLKHQFADRQSEWDMRFASSGNEALTQLEFQGVADVVVADLRMPMMDGAALLDAVRVAHPDTVRIIVSDFRDLSSALRSIPVAHQFLQSPIQPSELRSAIERSIELQLRIDDPALRSLIGSIDVLPSPPLSVVELNRALSRQDASIEEVAHAIESDAAMTAKLLQLVNSAFFGLTHRVTNAQHAVAYLGLATVRNLLTAVELVRAFAPRNPELLRSVEELHMHSLAVAELSRSLMTHRRQMHDAFAAGMMHDIGLLALITCAPDKYLELRKYARESGHPLQQCELDVIGVTHPNIGAYLLTLWGLPFSLVEAVGRSHDADVLPERVMTPVHAVFIAEQVLNVLSTAGSSWEGGRIPEMSYLQELGVAESVMSLVGRVKA